MAIDSEADEIARHALNLPLRIEIVLATGRLLSTGGPAAISPTTGTSRTVLSTSSIFLRAISSRLEFSICCRVSQLLVLVLVYLSFSSAKHIAFTSHEPVQINFVELPKLQEIFREGLILLPSIWEMAEGLIPGL